MLEWEYTKIDLNQTSSKTDDLDALNRAGHQGWELVSLTPNNLAYLKRPVGAAASPAPAAAVPRKKERSSA